MGSPERRWVLRDLNNCTEWLPFRPELAGSRYQGSTSVLACFVEHRAGEPGRSSSYSDRIQLNNMDRSLLPGWKQADRGPAKMEAAAKVGAVVRVGAVDDRKAVPVSARTVDQVSARTVSREHDRTADSINVPKQAP